jgi:hypothetical protein
MQGTMMRVNAPAFRVSLQWGQPLTLADGMGTCITTRRGTVWITQDNDLRDVVLESGQSFLLDGRDLAIVQAFESAEIFVRPPAPQARPAASTPGRAPRSLTQRLLLALKRRGRSAAAGEH